MGIEGQQLYGAVRASFCRYHTQNDINFAAKKILAAVRRIQDQQ
jgi:cysteine desulfurase